MTICILGRQPELSLAELEQLFGADKISAVAPNIAMINLPHEEVAGKHLGGSIKVAKALKQLPTNKWNEVVDYICQQLPRHTGNLPEGKVKLGVSVHGMKVSLKELERSTLKMKKVIKAGGKSVRVVPNTDLALNSAQVLHNKLTGPTGMELLLLRSGNSTWMAQTVAVQNIESYTLRDRGRPKRDAKVGMLPPKLAQIMINLAKPGPGARVLDPFCGTGVLLQEAALMGYAVYGTDLEERMVSYTQDNLQWFKKRFGFEFDMTVHQADARTATWRQPIDAVICESYLGAPFPYEPYPDKLEMAIEECNAIITSFLQNLAGQVESGSRHCIAVPAWYANGRFHHLPLLDEIGELGYNRASFVHGGNEGLIYHRTDQVVARELLVITRK